MRSIEQRPGVESKKAYTSCHVVHESTSRQGKPSPINQKKLLPTFNGGANLNSIDNLPCHYRFSLTNHKHITSNAISNLNTEFMISNRHYLEHLAAMEKEGKQTLTSKENSLRAIPCLASFLASESFARQNPDLTPPRNEEACQIRERKSRLGKGGVPWTR